MLMIGEDLACEEAVALMTAYLEHAMPGPEQLRFERHLEDCPYCARYLDQMRETIRLMGKLVADSLDPDVRRGLLRLYRSWIEDTAEG